MSKKNKPVITPEFRVNFPNVFKAKLNEKNGKLEYSLVALFPKNADMSYLKDIAQEAVEKKWGTDSSKWPKPLKTPFRDQAEREKQNDEGKMTLPPGYEKGGVFMNLKTTLRPGVVDGGKQPIIEDADFYSGCWAIASINVFAYDVAGNRGVTFYLCNIQKVRDDDSLGSRRTTPEDDFQAIDSDSEGTPESASSLFG